MADKARQCLCFAYSSAEAQSHLGMRKLPISHFWTALAGALRRCYAFVWPCHTALVMPSTASPQHRQKRDIDNFRITKHHRIQIALLPILLIRITVATSATELALRLRELESSSATRPPISKQADDNLLARVRQFVDGGPGTAR